LFLFVRQGMESELNHNPDSVQKNNSSAFIRVPLWLKMQLKINRWLVTQNSKLRIHNYKK